MGEVHIEFGRGVLLNLKILVIWAERGTHLMNAHLSQFLGVHMEIFSSRWVQGLCDLERVPLFENWSHVFKMLNY